MIDPFLQQTTGLKASFTSAWTGPVNNTATFYVIRDTSGIVTLAWGQSLFTGVNSATPITMNLSNMPAWARPRSDTAFPVFVRDAGVYQSSPGSMVIAAGVANGSISKTYASSAWSTNATASGNGMESGAVSYVGVGVF